MTPNGPKASGPTGPKSDMGIPVSQSTCKRCGKPFTPEPSRLKAMGMTRCCKQCQFRNLMDGLDIPTPPAMLDRHTKVPTLTDREYRKAMKELDCHITVVSGGETHNIS